MGAIVCFTGHRDIPEEDYLRLANTLEDILRKLIEEGATEFRTGGARGFDTLAALKVLLLRKSYPQIRLELILPCPTQTRGWSQNDTALYKQILAQADAYRYIGPSYYNGVLQMRNRALVAGADICVAYLRHSHGGGTAYTAALALREGLRLINPNEYL
ncbi:MAG: DUF1273 domain-containing protein [Ruminococcaceae bacterium]|nr:DUF1273 domain-containing protein [Oscillospiraceae bacterium]